MKYELVLSLEVDNVDRHDGQHEQLSKAMQDLPLVGSFPEDPPSTHRGKLFAMKDVFLPTDILCVYSACI
jgi:hypothetical protein